MIKITLRNYRAFDDSHPVEWELNDDFRAFVGVNNSGKSSLLRFFHEARPALKVLLAPSNGTNQAAIQGQPQALGFQSVADQQEVLCNRNTRDMTAEFALSTGTEPRSAAEPSRVVFRWRRSDAALTIGFVLGDSDVLHATRLDGQAPVVRYEGTDTPLDLTRYVELFTELAAGLYLGPFRNAVNVGAKSDYYDLQIGEAFIATWDQYKTGNNRAQNRQAIGVERELQEIFGFDKLELNAAPNNQTLQVIVDDQPYQLQEQGAGLAQFIVVLAFVALRRPPYVFIDEPEQNLHPALQLDFLTTLAKFTTRGVVFSTHSIGLARAIAQQVYSVRRLPDESREVRPLEGTRNLVEFLGELNLSGYEELGFRSILLVEGTTEVPTVQRWLRLYGIDHEVVLMPLGGSSMINARSGAALTEIKRITTKVAVLIDSERPNADAPLAKDRAAFVKTCGDLGFDVHVLERRALENYLTDSAVKTVKGEKYGALGEYESLKDAAAPWGKHENWRIAAEMRRPDLDGTDLGDFLSALADGADQ